MFVRMKTNLYFFSFISLTALGAPGTASSTIQLDDDPALIKEWAYLVQTVQTNPLDKVKTKEEEKMNERNLT